MAAVAQNLSDWELGSLAASGGESKTEACSKLVNVLLSNGFSESAAGKAKNMFCSAANRLVSHASADGADRVKCFWVPGRVEVMGKHTDYAGGKSLLGAVSRGFALVTRARDDGNCRVFTQFADGSEANVTLELTDSVDTVDDFRQRSTADGGWALYPATAIQRLASNFTVTNGCDISIECSLPEASGMSSSSAVICYMWMVLNAYNNIENQDQFKASITSNAELYTYLGNIENGQTFKPGQAGELVGAKGVGTFGGSEDHTAIMSCCKGGLKMWQYCPTAHLADIDVDPDVRFVIAVSGAKAEKTGGAMDDYNDAALLALWGACTYVTAQVDGDGPISRELLQQHFGDVQLFNPSFANLAEVVRKHKSVMAAAGEDTSSENLRANIAGVIRSLGAGNNDWKAALTHRMGHLGLNFDGLDSDRIQMDTIITRYEQYFDESEVLVEAAAQAFQSRNYEALGQAVDKSHQYTVEKLRNTIPETAWLPRWARGIDGAESAAENKSDRITALAASAFGAGFGGSCWALVRSDEADTFAAQWEAAYATKFPVKEGGLKREFFVMGPGTGAFQVQ